MAFQDLLNHSIIFLDGGTGTMLQSRGLKPGERTEMWNVEHPEEVSALHQSYVEAGSDIINTNTFGVSKFRYNETSQYSLKYMVQTAVDNVRAAITQANPGREILISLDMGPTGEFLEPFGNLTEEEAYDNYHRLAEAGVNAGVDCITIETMFTCAEAREAMRAAGDCSSLPMLVSFSFNENGRLLSGETVAQAALAAEEGGASAVGFNCGFGPEQMLPLVKELKEVTTLPIIAKPNAGLPDTSSGEARYTMSPQTFTSVMQEIAALGIRFAGGCCGTTPEYIKMLRETL